MWILYAGFIVYGALIPFSLVTDLASIRINISQVSWVPFIDADGSRASIPDIVQNILLFLPFGFLGVFTVSNRRIGLVIFTGMALSASVECLQLFTTDRITSLTDLTTNTLGTAVGVFLAVTIVKLFAHTKHHKFLGRLIADKDFQLALIASAFVAGASLQPFDFTLDIGVVGTRIKSIISEPVVFTTISSEGALLLRTTLLTIAWGLWLEKWKIKHSTILAFLIGSAIALSFEGLQLIVRSRLPDVQDGLAALLGSMIGMLILQLKKPSHNQTVWISAMVLATFITAAIQTLSPFRLASNYRDFNWIPFLAYYERTSFLALANFIESLIVYLPLGFVVPCLQKAQANRRAAAILLFFATLMVASILEFTQGLIVSRYPDVTDVIGALMGVTLGYLCFNRWQLAINGTETRGIKTL